MPCEADKPYYVHPKMSNNRILSQAGAFIIYGLQRKKSINYAHKIQGKHFVIPASSKMEIRSELENLGINESTLFPEIDRAAKRIKERYSSPKSR